MNTTLTDFATGRMKSTRGSREYETTVAKNLAKCNCKHGHVHGWVERPQWCTHARDLRNRILEAENTRLRSLTSLRSGDEAVDYLGMISQRVYQHRKPDTSIIGNTLLMVAFLKGEVCADDVHEHVADLLQGDTRAIGAVANGLRVKGWFHIIGEKSSARKTVNHGRPIKIFALTKEGKEKVAEAVLADKPSMTWGDLVD